MDRLTANTGENETAETKASYDAYGKPLSMTDAQGNTTKFEYDRHDNLVCVTRADGGEVKYTYYENGLLQSQTDACGNTTVYTYDASGRIETVTDGEENTVSLGYDAYGNLSAITDGEGSTYRMEYDKVGNVLAVYDAYGKKIESYTYDAVYNRTSVTNANGGVIEYTYDSMGNKVKELNKASGSVTTYAYVGGSLISAATDALAGNTSATYDAMGNLLSFTNPNGGVTTYTYDQNQNVTSETVGDYYHVEYTYNGANQVKTTKNSRGQTATYEYDKAGRVTKQADEAGTITYTYDANGNVLTVSEVPKASEKEQSTEDGEDSENSQSSVSANTITRTYDALNRVKTYTDAKGNTIGYEYDEFGNLTKLTYPDGKAVTYTYDKNGNRLTATDWNNRTTAYAYDKNGRLIKTTRADGSVENRTYDDAGQLLTIKDQAKDGTVITDLTYGYDLSGNIVLIKDGKAGTTLSAENENTASEKDSETDQYVSESGQSTNNTGDSAESANVSDVSDHDEGSMETNTGLTSSTTTMEYDSVNRLIKYNGKIVEYDTDGNMTYGPLDGEMAHFTYDCRNRLISVKTDSGAVTQYRYNAENNRTGVTKNAGTDAEESISYVVDTASGNLSQVLVKETDNEIVYYTYGNGLIAQEKVEKTEKYASEYLVYHFNNVGSTVAVTDEKGSIKHTYSYTPYGELINGKYGEVDYLYNGQYGVTSDANGLYYMRARYYNIDIKRFINQDILTGSIDSSKSLNRYAYVEGNPISYLDPFGLSKYDTTYIHEFLEMQIKYFSYISAGSIITSIFAPAVSSVAAVLASYCSFISGGLSFINGLFYTYDALTAESAKEFGKSIVKAISSFLSTFIAFQAPFGNTNRFPSLKDNDVKAAADWLMDWIQGGIGDIIRSWLN